MRGRRGWPGAAVLALVAGTAGCAAEDTGGRSNEWREPAAYRYTVESSAGERSGLGTYTVTVRGHKVVAAVGHDEPGRQFVRDLGEVPTIGDLLDELEAARSEHHADRAEARYAADGHPVRISLDYEEDAIDDEAEYRITDYRATDQRDGTGSDGTGRT
ncbi:DUF6174 domain-containing protein [Streptomyces monticola]|uniref:DUF6174 domain-containing protein n=1 Tax=Streptomyces monticola TaxID=2666263 RepID=A0ABW2JCK4_9ACTN